MHLRCFSYFSPCDLDLWLSKSKIMSYIYKAGMMLYPKYQLPTNSFQEKSNFVFFTVLGYPCGLDLWGWRSNFMLVEEIVWVILKSNVKVHKIFFLFQGQRPPYDLDLWPSALINAYILFLSDCDFWSMQELCHEPLDIFSYFSRQKVTLWPWPLTFKVKKHVICRHCWCDAISQILISYL